MAFERNSMITEETKTLIIIPSYNEVDAIGQLLDEISVEYPGAIPLVIDDGSTDGTAVIAHEKKARVLKLPINLGIGGAVQTGLKYASQGTWPLVVRMDGDGQHDPKDIASLKAPVENGEADVVIGSRFKVERGYRPGVLRMTGIRLLRFIILLFTGFRVSDPTSGFCCWNREAMVFLASRYPQDYPEPEALAELSKNGFNVIEVPVTMRERIHGESTITAIDSIKYLYKVIMALVMIALRKT